MQLRRAWLCVGLWLLLCVPGRCLPALPPAILEDLQDVSSNTEVTVYRGPCSTTCGLGLRTEERCMLGEDGTHRDCVEKRARCLITWQCGLRTLTAPTGGSVELDCLEEVIRAQGSFGYFLSWRYARGLVTTDNSLFSSWTAPGLDHITLAPLREEDAGTYRCDVQDSTHRMVKRIYFGVKVLPPEVLQLDFASALSQWDVPQIKGSLNQTSDLGPQPLYPPGAQTHMVLYSLGAAVAVTVVTLLSLLFACRRVATTAPQPRSTQ